MVPQSLIQKILKSYHESPTGGCTGISRIIHKIQNKYYWTTLYRDTTTRYIKSCHDLQINKKMNGKAIGQLQPVPLSNRPLPKLTYGYLGSLTYSNNKNIFLYRAVIIQNLHSPKLYTQPQHSQL